MIKGWRMITEKEVLLNPFWLLQLRVKAGEPTPMPQIWIYHYQFSTGLGIGSSTETAQGLS
jgi:hypothetical protein